VAEPLVEPAARVGAAPAHAEPWVHLQRLIVGYRLTQALGVVARLGIADLLQESARSNDDLARACGADSDALYRVLRLLASEGVFVEVEPRRFALTPAAALLRSAAPGSMRARALIEAGEWSMAWAELPYCVATGQPSFARVFGAPPFEYYGWHPQAAALFDATMASMTTHTAAAVAAAYDFSQMRTVVDVGGGRGALLASILRRNPGVRGILFDRPGVLEGAATALAEAGVADRCELAAGDFFAAVPANGDAYLLKFILDDWNDADGERILRTIRRSMPAHGRVLVVEMPILPGNDPFYGKWTDVNMLVMLGGRERTQGEYAALLERAGLRLARVVQTASDFSILEAIPS
jgi:ubiquinone/menaquinone biosynthesis C-methylase UbiE